MDNSWEVLEQAGELARSGEPFALATVVWRQGPSSSQQGSRAIITASGQLHGWIGGACAEPSVIRESQQASPPGRRGCYCSAARSRPGRTARAGDPAPEGMTLVPISCQSEGALEVYIEPVLPVPHLVVIGRSPMSQTLVSLAATLGWRADLIDGPGTRVADAGPTHRWWWWRRRVNDDEALIERAATAQPAYLGLVGVASARCRGARLPRRSRRAEGPARPGARAGWPRSRQHYPSRDCCRDTGRARSAPGIRRDPAQSGGEAADGCRHALGGGRDRRARQPSAVCGMTVPVTSLTVTAEHEHSTYYFCSAGCRQAFVQDPAAYLKRDARC